MARLAVSKDYFGAYSRLPRKAQRKADEFLTKFQRDSTTLSIHLEPIAGAVDSQLRSARIGDDYRVVLRAPESGDVFLVLWADHHDEAYRWAANKQTAVHPATGSLQIFDAAHATREVTSAPAWEARDREIATEPDGGEEAARLFSRFSDVDLFHAGVPSALVPSVRFVGSEDELDSLLPHLPPEAGEVLTGLAAGLSLDEALEEVLGRITPPAGASAPTPIDVTDVVAALARETTQRQFRLLEGELDLDAALKHPLDVWRVFLHPRQRRIARAHTKGPTRVLGGAGTGKTVVALHRVGFLVREVYKKPDDRVLFTTFTRNLAHDLKSQLAKLLEPDELARVEVTNIDQWASEYVRSRGRVIRLALDSDQKDHFAAAYEVYGDDVHTLEFYRTEWREVVQEQALLTEDEYVRAVRKHRGIPLGRAERRALWPVFEAYRANLERDGMLEPIDVLRLARTELESSGETSRYRSVVVDETQDFSADALRLVRAIAGPEHPDDLFLVGDAHQRIYRRPAPLSACGIQVRGRRSQTLRLNYRTTGSICRWSLRVLDGIEVDDLDDGKADRRGYVSVREGVAPFVQCFATALEEERAVVETVQAAIELGHPPQSICIVARTRRPLVDRFGPALERAGIDSVLLDRNEVLHDGVRLATMHRIKGLEFGIVILADASKGEIPLSTPELSSDDPIVSAQALLRERSLLYVAASRARDELYVFASGALSPLVSVFASKQSARRPTPSAPPSEKRAPSLPPAPKSVPPPVADVAPIDLDEALATPLSAVPLPTRMQGFVDRTGLSTLADLARHAPSSLLREKNLGRTSIAETREILEGLTGRAWESLVLRAAPDVESDAEVEAGVVDEGSLPLDWDELRTRFSDEQRAEPLARIDLPARVQTLARNEGITTLGELARYDRVQLLSSPNMGRTSVSKLPRAIVTHFAELGTLAQKQRVAAGHEQAVSTAERTLGETGLLECWKTLLEGLDTVPRMILTRRSGLAGEAETLLEIGEILGVSRERVRQIESKACKRLIRRAWVDVATARVDRALIEGAAPLSELATDPWWSAAAAAPEVLGYVVEHVLELPAFVIELDGGAWLARHKGPEIAKAWSRLREQASRISLPAPARAFDELTAPLGSEIGLRLAKQLADQLRGQMILEEARDEGEPRVVALGESQQAKLLAILRSAPSSLHTDEVFAQLGGRVHLPDDVIHFGRGHIGVRAHIPDFDEWRDRLVPRAVQLIETLGPDRQWSCTELHDELREELELPDWCGPFVLAALIRSTDSLTYLGRLRVVLPGGRESESRVYVHEAIETLLRDAREPMAKDDLIAAIRERIGVSDFALTQALGRPQFVRVDAERVGLLERDVPGGADALAEATDQVASVLGRRDRGLSAHHAHEEVRVLSSHHARWSEQLTFSVLHGDARFRFSQSGAVGLASWDSTRVPTRFELIRNALRESDGRVSLEALGARIEAHYGERPSRATLISIAAQSGARVDGEWMLIA
ncbi:MAG: AAA family ATPase [Myxococcota bacterium]|nr:AAA family ATPase [Myxococcota bacterium]